MRMASIREFGFAATLLIVSAYAQSWKQYPLSLETNPPIIFPQIEGIQPQNMGDSWFMTAQVTGMTTGKKYQIVNIFDRNYITAVELNFYQASIFNYDTKDFVTYTDYDLPAVSLLDMKFRAAAGYLDLGFNSGAGNATWTTLSPFNYQLHCPGIDHQGQGNFLYNLNFNMEKKPVPYGAATLKGNFEFYGQDNTISYFQTAPRVTGSLTMKGVTENVTGTFGHLDRQIFPLYSGIYTPTGRQHSHEWRQINFDNGLDLAIWRQFDRTQNNSIIETSGTTASPPGTDSSPQWTDALPEDLTVEYISYSKYPRANFTTLIPPPSPNMYLPASHIIRSTLLGLEVQGTYINEVPAVTLPIEYFEGPAIWKGTYQGTAVRGVGIFESTLGLYRDWELAKVLFDSVIHLPDAEFSATMNRTQVAREVDGVNDFVSSNVLLDDRVRARAYIETHIIPALDTMEVGKDKNHLLEIASDLQSSLDLILQF